jgi:hypothetical protein
MSSRRKEKNGKRARDKFVKTKSDLENLSTQR